MLLHKPRDKDDEERTNDDDVEQLYTINCKLSWRFATDSEEHISAI